MLSHKLITLISTEQKLDIIQLARTLTIANTREGAQLSLLRKNNNEKTVWKAIVLLLKDVCAHFDLSFDNNVCVDIAINITDKHYHFRLEDVLLCFTMGKRGDFGKVYHKTLSIIIMEWLEHYDQLHEMHYVSKNEADKTVAGSNKRTNSVMTFSDIAKENKEFNRAYAKGMEKAKKDQYEKEKREANNDEP